MYDDDFTDENLSKDQKYYRRHKERVAAKNKKYHTRTKDKFNPVRRENARRYYEIHKEKINAKRRK